MDPIKINENAVIAYGPLKDINGKVIEANWLDKLVTIKTENGAQVTINWEAVKQGTTGLGESVISKFENPECPNCGSHDTALRDGWNETWECQKCRRLFEEME